MKVNPFVCAAIVAALMPAVALADDPHDPTMRSAAARARDSAGTRQLNRQELARVRARDARNGGWRSSGRNAAADAEYAERSTNYAHDRAQYERQMAAWRRAVAACQAGDYSACDR
jgi:hypothetical protein